MNIVKLDECSSSKIYSLSRFATFGDVVCALLQNSIDACATRASITVDLVNLSILVIDNGNGVTEDDLKVIGKRNYSSNRSDTVHRGESLHCISQFGSVIISSGKHTVHIRNDEREYSQLEDGENEPDIGSYTRIYVSDLFGNIPLRRSHVSSLLEEKHCEELREKIMKILVLRSVEFELNRSNSSSSSSSSSSSKSEPIIQVPAVFVKAPNSYGKIFTHIYGDPKSFRTVESLCQDVKLTGVISNELSNKKHHYFFVNGQELTLDGQYTRAINSIYKDQKSPVVILNIQPPMTFHSTRGLKYQELYGKLILKTLQEGAGVVFEMSRSPSKSPQLSSPGSHRSLLESSFRNLQPSEALKRLQEVVNIKDDTSFASVSNYVSVNIDKEVLRAGNFRVIKQLDKKFILLTTRKLKNVPGGSTILIIDQHACDERIRLESLLQQFIEQCVSSSDNGLCIPVIPFEVVGITKEESQLFAAKADQFKVWGIKYKVSEAIKIEITHLPRLLIDKEFQLCDPAKISHTLLEYLYHLENNNKSQLSRKFSWVENIRNLPPILLDILNSKACRSSIMFGTELSYDEMNHMIEQLGNCEYPFICAHGRPSIVPVASIQ